MTGYLGRLILENLNGKTASIKAGNKLYSSTELLTDIDNYDFSIDSPGDSIIRINGADNAFLLKLLCCLKNNKPFLLTSENGNVLEDAIETIKNCHYEFPGYITTSGSSGKPKLIGIDEKTLLENLTAFSDMIGGESYGVFLSPSYSFGFNCIITALIKGRSLCIADQNKLNDAFFFLDFVKNEPVDTIFCPVSILNFLCNNALYKSINRKDVSLVYAGERSNFSDDFIEYCKENNIILQNVYGMTETGIIAVSKVQSRESQHQFNVQDIVDPYGIEMEETMNMKQLVLNKRNLIEGFFDLTSCTRCFDGIGNAKDHLVFFTKDNIDFANDDSFTICDRADYVVKVNGKRISIKHIEDLILQIDGVKDCAVYSAKGKSGGELLSASIVANEDVSQDEILACLKKDLPDHLIPILLFASEIPLNANGKKDRILLANKFNESSLGIKSILCLFDKAFGDAGVMNEVELYNKTLCQLGLDSLNVVFLSSLLEGKYNVNFDMILTEDNLSLREIVNYARGARNE